MTRLFVVEALGDDVSVFPFRVYNHKYEVDDNHDSGQQEGSERERVVEPRGDQVCCRLLSVAELLPGSLHRGVLVHPRPGLLGELEHGLAATGESKIDGGEQTHDDQDQYEERVDDLAGHRLLWRRIRCSCHLNPLTPSSV